jgi:hypothetical protein
MRARTDRVLREAACPVVRRAIAAGLAAALSAACNRGAPSRPEELAVPPGVASTARATQHAGPLVVAIVVDQFAAWVAHERLPLLPEDGGFARLLREGTYARDMRYAHAVTDTAPGHAALYTGAPPRRSGVWGNELLEPGQGRVSILSDPATKLVFPSASAWTGSSARILTSDTVADRYRAAHSGAVIVSLSLKDRGAIFGGGRHPTAVLWYDRSLDRFVTSTAFPPFPAWAEPLDVPTAVRAEPWALLDEPWVRRHAATPDGQAGEGLLDGRSITFPHDIAHAGAPPKAFSGSPAADAAILQLALVALDAERAAGGTRLLALSLSANDYVGHAFGPDSWEAWDELRRLDAGLARFFAALDERFGPNGWSAVLAADHGVTTMPEAALVPAARPWCKLADAAADRWQRPCSPVGRLFASALEEELAGVAESVLHKKGLVAGIIDPYVYLTRDARALGPPDRARLVAALVAALEKHPEVARVVDTAKLPGSCPPESDGGLDALVCRSFVPGRAGDLYVVVRPGSFFDPDWIEGRGTSHGSPYLFDRSVPLIVRAPGRAAAGRTIDEPIGYRAFARALSSLLAVEAPDAETASAVDVTKSP